MDALKLNLILWTFIPNYDEDYTPSKNYNTFALELAQLVYEDKNNISMQHPPVGNSENPYIIKHGDKIGFIKIQIFACMIITIIGYSQKKLRSWTQKVSS